MPGVSLDFGEEESFLLKEDETPERLDQFRSWEGRPKCSPQAISWKGLIVCLVGTLP